MAMVKCSNPRFNRWDRLGLDRIWVVDVLISHRDTFIVQGFYTHKISILANSKKFVSHWISLATSLGVSTTLQVCSQLSNVMTPQVWIVGSVLCDIVIAMCMTYLLCGFLTIFFSSFWRVIKPQPCSLWQQSWCTTCKQTKIILKKVICLPTIETGSLTGTKILFQSSIYMSIPVVIGIVCFSLSILKLWLLEKFTQTQCLPDATCSGETPSTILPTTKIAQYMHIIAKSH